MRFRAFLAALLVTSVVVLAAPSKAKALHSGIYFASCIGNVAYVYDVIGACVATGFCAGWTGPIKIIVQGRIAAPPEPTLSPSDDPIWQGHSAMEWVQYVDGFEEGNNGDVVDPSQFGDNLPTLTCNEAHFD